MDWRVEEEEEPDRLVTGLTSLSADFVDSFWLAESLFTFALSFEAMFVARSTSIICCGSLPRVSAKYFFLAAGLILVY